MGRGSIALMWESLSRVNDALGKLRIVAPVTAKLPLESQIEFTQLVQHFEEGARGLSDFVKRLEGGK